MTELHPLHANCIVVGTFGVLITGASGNGKTSLSQSLLEAARAKGHFAALVADDRTSVTARQGRLIASVPAPIAGKMELRGFGVLDVAHQASARIALLVDLVPLAQMERIPETPLSTRSLAGVDLPIVTCPENRADISIRLIRCAFQACCPEIPDYI